MIGFLRYIALDTYRNYRLYKHLKQKFPSLELGRNIACTGPLENLKVGEQVQIQSNVVLHLGGEDWCHRLGRLEIGAHSCISPYCVIWGAGPGGVRIGNYFDCGPGVKIFSSRTDMEQAGRHVFAPVVIGDNVTLYANVVVSPGVTIGDCTVIAANAVVTTDIPANCFAGGVPARIIKEGVRNH